MPQETPGFRWRLIPATLLTIFGVLVLVAVLGQLAIMTWVHFRFGPVVPHPDTPALNSVAFTTPRIASLVLRAMAGPTDLLTASAFWRQRWRGAVLWAIAFFVLGAIAKKFGI